MSQELIDAGVRQGAVIDCSCLDGEIIEKVKQCRAVPSKRGKEVTSSHRLLVLSQDCDISNTRIDFIEVLAVKCKPRISTGDRAYTAPRNYLKVYLEHYGLYLECKADYISCIPKTDLNAAFFDSIEQLNERSHRILLDWRTGYYKREPFPHTFNVAFHRHIRQAENNFEAFLQEHYQDILDLYVFVSPSEENAPHYEVSITASLSDGCTSELRETIEQKLKAYWQAINDSSENINFIQITETWEDPAIDNFTHEFTARREDISLLDLSYLRIFNTDFLCYPDVNSDP